MKYDCMALREHVTDLLLPDFKALNWFELAFYWGRRSAYLLID